MLRSSGYSLAKHRLTQTADTIDRAVIKTALSAESVMSEINWEVEHKRFMDVAFNRTLKAAKRAFSGWHISKQEDSIACCIGKMWDQWSVFFSVVVTQSP